MTLPSEVNSNKGSRAVLITGATGFIGRFLAEASIDLGHPTYILIRPGSGFGPSKASTIKSLQERGAIVVQVCINCSLAIVNCRKLS